MNYSNFNPMRTLVAAAVAGTLIAGCASTPKQPPGSADVRAKLTRLQSETNLASRAPLALKDAEAAVKTAETPQKDAQLAAHRVYIADRKVDTARALAETRAAEAERLTLNQLSEKARLDARTREADQAKAAAVTAKVDAANARADSAEQKLAMNQARGEADAAMMTARASQDDAALAQQRSAELQRQIALLEARPTDRGLVLTLGDTLFATGKSDLRSGATANLDRLATFLNEYPKRTASIEGFTDSRGSEEFNQALSQSRAESVKRYLEGRGIDSARLSASGRGENAPVADNESAAGRQQNRRVEVVISQAAELAGAN